ncbi:MAG: MFS transporter [Proteobacteria bacterium]|nr:MFS transporter [Pseudomonadota bacterium]
MKRDRGWAIAEDPLKYRWLIFWVIGAIYFLACLHRISPTVIAMDLVFEFGAGATALGLMSSSYFYLYAAVQPPVGVLSDTLGPRRVITISTLIACVGAVIFGSALNMTMATVGRALIGMGVGGIFVPGMKILSKWYRQREFAGVTGIFLAAGNAGNLAASLPLTYLVLLLGWRMSSFAIAAVTFVLAVISWNILRDNPEDKGWQRIEVGINQSLPAEGDLPAGIRPRTRLRVVFSKPGFWMITLSTFFFGGPALTFQGLWAVPYLMDIHDYSRLQAGGLLMMLPLGFVIGAPTFGFLADKVSLGRKGILLCSLGLSLSCWTVFLLSGGKPNSLILGPLFLIMGSCGGGSLSLYMTITKELFPPWLTGTALGLMNPAAFLSTAVFQPFTGFLMDAVGRSGSAYPLAAYYNVFIVIFICMAIGFVSIIPLKIPETRLRAHAKISSQN